MKNIIKNYNGLAVPLCRKISLGRGFKAKISSNCSSGFTLAEVLITLFNSYGYGINPNRFTVALCGGLTWQNRNCIA